MPGFRSSALVPILLIMAGANGARAQLPNVRAKLNQPEKDGLYGEVEGGAEWKTGNTDTVVLNGLIRLALRISFSLSYDRCPPKNVDPLDTYLSTRLVVTFGPI